MAILGKEIRKKTKLPLGVNVLWNDYRVSLSLAKLLNLQFIRVPVFVDKVRASCGVIEGNPQAVLKTRRDLKAEQVAIFTDIHVKHAVLVSRDTIRASASLAKKYQADAVIVTGKWTGDAPALNDLKQVREALGDNFPVLAGSGADSRNIRRLLRYASGVIISTSLKKGGKKQDETNVKTYNQRIDQKKVRSLIRGLTEN